MSWLDGCILLMVWTDSVRKFSHLLFGSFIKKGFLHQWPHLTDWALWVTKPSLKE